MQALLFECAIMHGIAHKNYVVSVYGHQTRTHIKAATPASMGLRTGARGWADDIVR